MCKNLRNYQDPATTRGEKREGELRLSVSDIARMHLRDNLPLTLTRRTCVGQTAAGTAGFQRYTDQNQNALLKVHISAE